MQELDPKDDFSQANPGPDSTVALEELRYNFEGLRSLFLLAMLGLIVAVLAVDVFFIRRQMVFARNQAEDQRPKVNKMLADYKKGTEPLVKSFTTSMQNFAATNRDFLPIVEKYRPYLWHAMNPAAAGTSPPAAPKVPTK
jgi:hypothetical protein